jgi:hypothetical protein
MNRGLEMFGNICVSCGVAAVAVVAVASAATLVWVYMLP